MAAFSSSVPAQVRAHVCVCVRVTETEMQSSSHPLCVLVRTPEWTVSPQASAPQTDARPGQSPQVCGHCHPLLAPSLCPEQVPDAIKSQYQFPPPLIAPAAIRDGELICNGIPEESQTHLVNSEHLATQAEQQEVSEGRLGFHTPSSFHLAAAVAGSHSHPHLLPPPPSPTLSPYPNCHRPAP